jgi:mevalonate kinase
MARGHGKLILVGEHAVVYGVQAIAAGIERGVEAHARAAAEASLRVGERRAAPDDGTELGRAFAALLEALDAPPLGVVATAELPLGVGLGGSAAIGVAVARAVLEATAGPAAAGDTERVLAAAGAWERVFHGNPSGIDAAAATLGGCILYSKAGGATPIALARPLAIAVAIAGPPASTREMVESVARLRQRRPEPFEKTLDAIRALVRNARLCIEAGDVPGLGKLLDLNQMLLSGWMVSNEAIETACALARAAGAWGAKLTGAGGGGCVIALTEPDATPVLDAWRGAGLDCFATLVRATRSARRAGAEP